MAKKDPDGKRNTRDKENKGGLVGRLIITVISLALFLLVAAVGFNFAGMRERYLRGIIDSIPIVNSLFPPPQTHDGDRDPRDLMTNAELISEIYALQNEIDMLNSDNDDLKRRIGIYTAEIENLRAVEEQQEQFRNDKNEFDKLIAMRDPASYTKFYESISPENADTLYREAGLASGRVQALKRLTNTVSAMEESTSARMLETLMATDMDLVVLLLTNISTGTSGMIIESMSAENAAAVVKRMAPPGD